MTKVRLVPLVVLLGVLALAGCGAAPAKTKLPVQTGVFTNAKDCASSLKQTVDVCRSLIDAAMTLHTSKAKSYISARLCEDAEGAGRCERLSEKEFKPRLVAFLGTMAAKPVGEPLYLPKAPTEASFTSLDKSKTFKVVDETLTVTEDARSIAGSAIKKKR